MADTIQLDRGSAEVMAKVLHILADRATKLEHYGIDDAPIRFLADHLTELLDK